MLLILQTQFDFRIKKYNIRIDTTAEQAVETKEFCSEVRQKITDRILPLGDKYTPEGFNNAVNQQIIRDIFMEIKKVATENRTTINVQHVQRG